MVEDTDTAERIELLCVGLVGIKGSAKLVPEFSRLYDGQRNALADTQCWDSMTSCRVGCVYSVECTAWNDEAKSIRPATVRFVREWPSAEERLQFQANAAAKKTAHDAERMRSKREKAANAVESAMAPLRELYQRSLPDQRRALIAVVMFELTRVGGRSS